MMSVEISGRFLFAEKPTGTHRSAEAFARALSAARGGEGVRIWCHPEWPRVQSFQADVACGFGQMPKSPGVLHHLWEQFVFPSKIGQGIGLSLLGTGPARGIDGRHLMLVHDLNSLIFPEAFSVKYRAWSSFAKYAAIKRATALFCLTDYVKSTIVEHLGIAPERISVIPQGPGLKQLEECSDYLARSERRHFLCVGGLQPHKNLAGILRAWDDSGLAGAGYHLKVIGKRQANFSALTGITHEMAGVEFTGYVDDQELVRLYRNAIALVYPSFHEGFGLPVVEAFFSGTPVITSNCSCLPEVAGKAAILVDPRVTDDLAQAMRRVAGEDFLWRELAQAGWIRREKFRWATAGAKLNNLINSVGAGQPGTVN